MKTKKYTEADIDQLFWEASVITVRVLHEELVTLNDQFILAGAQPLTIEQILGSLERLALMIETSRP